MKNNILSPLHLKSRKKWTSPYGVAMPRIKSPEDTVEKIIPICEKIGVTRIADITNMDNLYAPNYLAILPGTEDITWVYGGKGITKAQAKASAIMESIERYSALANTTKRNFISGSYNELSRNQEILHPSEVVEPLSFEYENNMKMDFLVGVDVFSNQKILVPAHLVLWRYTSSTHSQPKRSSITTIVDPFAHDHTNGLASGNTLEEAVCHALCEVIERDAKSIAELCVSIIPYNILKNIIESINIQWPVRLNSNLASFVEDSNIFRDVDISEADFPPLKDLVKRFDKLGLPLIIKDITSDIGIPTILASSFDWINYDIAFTFQGQGTHPDARIALIRAITELSQGRSMFIQGSRDDLGSRNDLGKLQRERINESLGVNWSSVKSQQTVKFTEIKTYVNINILGDIKLILDNLKKAGLNKAIIVDLTNPDIGVPVVRAIVPGLETFVTSRSIMNGRARKSFRRLTKDNTI